MAHFIGKKIQAWAGIIRLPNLLILILIQLLVWLCVIRSIYGFYGTGLQLQPWIFALLVISTVFIAAGGYMINDLQDTDIDRINGKLRNKVGEILNPSAVWIIYLLLNAMATIMGFIISIKAGSFQMGLIFPAISGLLWFYSTRYKTMLFWGNLIIAILGALVILIVWLFEFMVLRNSPDLYLEVYKGLERINALVWSIALFAFLMTLLREWIKDVQDMIGDERYGSRSLPVVLGMKGMKPLLILTGIIIIVLLALAQIKLWQWGLRYTMIYLLITVQPLMVYLLVILGKAEKPENMRSASNLAKIIMLAGILSMELICLDL